MPAARAPRIRPAVAVQTLFILFGVVIAAYFPFLSMFLDSKGLTAGQIGGVIAGMAVARVILSPMWGHLADTTIGRRRALQIGAVGGAAAALALFAAESEPAIWATAIALAGVSATIAPNVDAIALGFLGDRMGDYGRMRGWESLSYATACLLFGIVLQQVGVRWDMPILAGAALVVFFWTIVAIEPDRPMHRIRHGRLGAVGAVFRAGLVWIFWSPCCSWGPASTPRGTHRSEDRARGRYPFLLEGRGPEAWSSAGHGCPPACRTVWGCGPSSCRASCTRSASRGLVEDHAALRPRVRGAGFALLRRWSW
jgi:MFS family permease